MAERRELGYPRFKALRGADLTDIALLWRPEQADALRVHLPAATRTIPLSQKAYAAARMARLPNTDARYFEALRAIDISALRTAADDAVRAHEAAGGGTLDRPAIWHNAHEAAFVRAAVERLLADSSIEKLTCAAEPKEPEAQALAQLCSTRGVSLEIIGLPISNAVKTSRIPSDLLFSQPDHVADSGSWRFILAVALADLADQMRHAARRGRIVVAVDAQASGDADAIHALARALGDVKVLPLGTQHAYSERGDNTAYAAEVERALAQAFKHPPEQVIVSDLRRVETVLAARAALACGIQPVLRAHGGGVMTSPYRFDDADGARSVWTKGARRLDRADVVQAPRTLRPPPAHRLARLALRGGRLFTRPRLGVVVTSGELFAAPEAHLASMIDAVRALCAAVGDADVVLRLRRLEDRAIVWKDALPDARFSIETRDDRPFMAFARACDLIVELGAESSAQLEAASTGSPYVRIDAPPPTPPRFLREDGQAPQLTISEAVALLHAPVRRFLLGLRQHRALERDTRPT